MLSDSVILPILLVKLKNCCKSSSGKSGAIPHTAQIWHPIWFPDTYMEQGCLQTVVSEQLARTMDDTSNVPDWKAGNSETTPENTAKPFEYPPFHQQFLNPPPLETALNGNNQDFHHPEPPVMNGKEEFHLPPTFHPASNAANWNSGKTASSASQPNGLNKEYEVQFPFYPTDIETPNHQGETGAKSNDRRDSRGKQFANLKDANIINGTSASEKELAVSESKPNLEITENKHEPNQQNRQNLTLGLNGDRRQSGVEDESIPFGYGLNANRKKLYPKTSDGNVILEDPDVSSNVLEIPKTTKKFENIGNSLQPPPIPQTNEDVHDVFEGFFNLRKNDPSSEQLLYNSYFIPSEPNGGRERNYPDGSLINSYPSFSHTRINNDTNGKKQWRENEPDISKISEVIASTDLPSLTTNAYSNYNGATISPTFWNGFSDSRALKSKPENSDNLNSTPQKVAHSSRSRTVELLQPISSKDENILNKVVDEYFTTGNPLYASTDKKYPDQRSDVSSESKLTETTETFTSSNLDRNLQETNERQNAFHSGVPEGISSQQIRFQNVLRNYKPDEIVIDVEKIPTQRPPESTLGFQGQVHSPNSNISPNLSRNVNGPKSEQTSGGTWRGRPIRKPNLPSRKAHNLQPGGLSFASRMPTQPRRNESNLFQHRVHDNNIRQLIYPSPQTLPNPLYNTHRAYKLDSLPPGVSIHPRHPKAPYADAVRSKVLPPVPQGGTPKLHRQRHHKKKDRLVHSCCRTRGKTKSCCGSCCRSKSLHSKPSCCSSTKPGKNELRPKQVLTASAPAPQQVRKPAEDPRNRCQKEKLCRTLYESTQQVMVCRHAKIEGC
ncbi:hypothetical protein AVEN_105945-1 [Araneus ventricosus]|uniref:Uncharacterized protein n=1 Tax=Araneus ventricosus TaxID=182803 RepID=A0A4Y2DWI9_ARAVE|nr:hypothetical protein AVEN_105945-1 [Araneus ventricosus]